ncbi:hypothetical protein GH5_07696 [Leishmania sp. Ghana 2012 LV757]|uniref:hypothetical protein n=1 Tax=Leishmania sp. Ghana 2012 LV757 TaxID=2803181 RepID=UPI001B63433C|nr:hypothetical protein GH5_07696 [Leishmania sp. Ghana 2012 LV757]
MSSRASLTAPMVVFHCVVDEQQQLSSSTSTRSDRANADSGDPLNDHAHHDFQYATSLSAPRKERAASPHPEKRVANGTSGAHLAEAAAATVEASPHPSTSSSLSGPAHHYCHSPTSSQQDVVDGVEEFLRKATNDADVPPGLLRFLQRQQSYQWQRPPVQRQSENRPLAYLSLVSTPSTNSVANATHTASSPQSPALPRHGLRSDASLKAAAAATARETLTAVNGYSSDDVLHHHHSSGSGGAQFYWSAGAVALGCSSVSAGEGEQEDLTHSVIGEDEVGGSGGGNTHARSRLTAAAATAKRLEADMYQQRHYRMHATNASSGNANGATERRQPAASALQRRCNTITDVYQGILGANSRGDATTVAAAARYDSSTSTVGRQRTPQAVHSTAFPSFFSFFGSRRGSQTDGLPRVLQVCGGSPLRTASGHLGDARGGCVHEVAGRRLPPQQQPEKSHQPRRSVQNSETGSAGDAEAAGAVPVCGSDVRESVRRSALSVSPVLSATSLVRSSPQSVASSVSARSNDSAAQAQPNVAGKESLKSRSCVLPPPLPQLWPAAPRASSRALVSKRLFSGVATANSMILRDASITDVPHMDSPPSVGAAACGRLAPIPGSAAKGSCNSVGVSTVPPHQPQPRLRRVQVGGLSNHSSSAAKSTGAEAVAAAVGIIDVVTAGSLSGRLSSYGEVEPSLTAGVAWAGPFSSYAPSITSPTAGTLTSTNYCYSGASSSMNL